MSAVKFSAHGKSESVIRFIDVEGRKPALKQWINTQRRERLGNVRSQIGNTDKSSYKEIQAVKSKPLCRTNSFRSTLFTEDYK